MKDSFAEINVVPLVDIMLVLIVIVLLTANFMVQGAIEVQLPKSDSEQNIVQEAIRFEINAEGTIFYNSEMLEQSEIALIMHGINREQPVLISADKDLRLQPFISLLDEVKKLGFRHISVHTIK